VRSEGLAEVVAAFGGSVLAADGGLAREKLGAIVFGDADARGRLQAILHPRIARRSAQLIAEQRAGAAVYVVYDAPLLVEAGAYQGLAALIVVAAQEQNQIARAMERDGVSREVALSRIEAQLPLARKLEVADYVIVNDGSFEELARRTLEIHAQILLRFGLSSGGQ
jgi:dephospho-CoA kinase